MGPQLTRSVECKIRLWVLQQEHNRQKGGQLSAGAATRAAGAYPAGAPGRKVSVP
jgi:hypothetical protein